MAYSHKKAVIVALPSEPDAQIEKALSNIRNGLKSLQGDGEMPKMEVVDLLTDLLELLDPGEMILGCTDDSEPGLAT